MICLAFNFTGSLHAELLQMKITLLFLTNLIASLALNAAQDTTSTKLDEVIIQENRISNYPFQSKVETSPTPITSKRAPSKFRGGSLK